MNVEENRAKWLTALRSGEYKQGTGWLHQADGSMCCLGVAAAMFKPDWLEVERAGFYYRYDDCAASAPDYVIEALGLRSDCGSRAGDEKLEFCLARLNDTGKTFEEIADIFETNVKEYTA